MNKKQLLILNLHKDIHKGEITLIINQSIFIEMDVEYDNNFIIADESDLEKLLKRYKSDGRKFDYVYLCSHGSKQGFDIDNGKGKHFVTWNQFSALICNNEINNEDAIFLLACCKGGLFVVAKEIFESCSQINYVCGVKCSVVPPCLVTGFIVFLHNIFLNKVSPKVAAERASAATNYSFCCYDRDDIIPNRFALNVMYLFREACNIITNSINLLTCKNPIKK
jgi:hypothetical protein